MSKLNTMISIVIPLYNKRSHIVKTVDSVLDQTMKNYEIIIVDDGSTDGSDNVVEIERGEYVRLIRQKNAGVSAARNAGIRAAASEYVAFLDADDSWEPHFLEEIVHMINSFPSAEFYVTAYQFKMGDNQYLDPKVGWQKPLDRPAILDNFFSVGSKGDLPFSMSGFCAKKSTIIRLGCFPSGETMGEDQDLFARAAIKSQIAYSPRVLSFYHRDAENRACNHNIPQEECPFSRRIYKWALQYEEDQHKKESMIDYTAAHLLHIASLNIKAKRLYAARKILDDERCRRNLKKFYWWKANYHLTKMGLRY